ncbi:VOC family protein [Thalassobius sp. Cn5-15]|uniref:VOC family protein n=1 Tax=Thalassobius sp. Cn5-15 TaxID=2917763 RepID=UPI001EF330F8|nr:VOC family protein [Thalassobius sp. Cn5-15]MCG7493406.1 VOC family protein [Thalassobius sp. Cn5-15]
MQAILEHANVTVANPAATAHWLEQVFGWHIRWQGDAISGGRSIHIGGADSYLALYAPKTDATTTDADSYQTIGALNHLAVVVADLDQVEARVRNAGFTPHMHADYEPGRRFYFNDDNGIEFEVVSYDS